MSLPIDHARLPKPGDIFAEKYRLECILGSGGMGVVFGATHLITHKRVAIKWLAGELAGGSLSDTTQRFVREARLAGEFHHPNIVQVYDLGESDGSFYMVMEWLEGESLAARLERVGRLSFAEVIASLIPCMHAMQRAHDCGIIHRDIKPANIFLCDATADRPAQCKVLDFGISKRITASADMSSFVTKTGMLIGTPHYLAPEQLRARPVDRRTDIYGFGVLLYQTLAGELPYNADNFGDLVVEISVGTPRSLRELVPDLPVGVEQVIARAMAREPEQRYQSLHELIASLQSLDPTPLTAATMPQINVPQSLRPVVTVVPDSAKLGSSRSRQVLAVAAAVGVLAAAAGFVLLQRDSQANDETSSIVRPRALPGPDVVAVQHQLPAVDAAVDSGQPILLEPAQPREAMKVAPAQAGELTQALEPKSSEAPREQAKTAESAKAQPDVAPKLAGTLKPAEQAKSLEPQGSKPKPGGAPLKPALEALEHAQPTAAPVPAQPAPDAHAPEHNPLHMNIQ